MRTIPIFGNRNNAEPELTFDVDFHERFWTQCHEYLTNYSALLEPFGSLNRDKSCDISHGEEPSRSYSFLGCSFGDLNDRSLWLIGWIYPAQGRIAAKLRLDRRTRETLFNQLRADKTSIDTYFNDEELEWDEIPKYSIGVYKNDVDFTNVSNWHESFEWLRVNLEKIEVIFLNKLAWYYLNERNQ